MAKTKYKPELMEQALIYLESIGDASSVAQKYNIPVHVIYRFRRDKLKAPELSKIN